MPVLEIMQELRSLRRAELPHHELTCDCERCGLAKSMSLESLRGLIGKSLVEPGIYGPRGWTVMEGVTTLTLPYSDWMWFDMARDFPGVNVETMTDYLPFSEGDAWLATHLLKILSPEALDDRQNYAPRLGSILKFTAEHPDEVIFSGYMIGPQRFDERLSVDALYVSAKTLEMNPQQAEDPDSAYRRLQKFELEPQGEPDEVCLLLREDNRCPMWRFWWD